MTKRGLSKEKEAIEIEILKEQLKKLNTPWYLKNEPWKLITSSLLTAASIFLLYINGAFEFKTQELKREKQILEIAKSNLDHDIKKLEDQKRNIANEVLSANTEIMKLNRAKQEYEIAVRVAYMKLEQKDSHVAYYVKKIEEYKQSIDELNNKVKIYETPFKYSSLAYQNNIFSPYTNSNAITNIGVSELVGKTTPSNISWPPINNTSYQVQNNIPYTDYFLSILNGGNKTRISFSDTTNFLKINLPKN